MDVTIDNLLNQFSRTVIDKLDRQSFDPDFLKKLFEGLLNKVSNKQSNVIEQPKPATTQKDKPAQGSIVEDLKKAYNDLLKDTTYINNYKLFLKKVFDKTLPSNQLRALTQAVEPKSVPNNKVYNSEDYEEGRRDLIKEEVKPQVVLFGGITDQGYKDLQNKLPTLLKGLLPKGPEKQKERPQGLGMLGLLGGGLALLLGGLSALVTGLMTDGPFKGLLKILSIAGIKGGIKLLEGAAKVFLGSIKNFIQLPTNMIKSAAKAIGRIFGKDVYKALLAPIRGLSNMFTGFLDNIVVSLKGVFTGIVTSLTGAISNIGKQVIGFASKMFGGLSGSVLKPLKGLTGIFGKILGGLVKVLKPVITKIPGIGTIISWGFAFSRFKSGDILGGTIDILSGIAALFPGIGTAIAIGLDVLNAFLDFKAGGANKKASEKKTGILGDWLKGLGKLVLSGLKSLPIIGPLIKSVEEFSAGNYLKGLKQLAYIATPLEFIGALLGDKEASGATKTAASVFRGIGSVLKNLGVWVAKTIWKVFSNIPIIGPALKGAKELFSGNFAKAFKQFLYINPAFELLGSLLGDQDVGGITGAVAGTIKGIGGILKDLGSWVFQQITKLPVLGPLIKMVGNFTSGEWKEGLKNLGRAVGLGGLISFFESKPDESGNQKETGSINPFKALRNAVMEKARNWWKKAWSWVRWLARRVLPSSVIKALDSDTGEKENDVTTDNTQGSKSLISAETLNRIKEATKKLLSNIKERLKGSLHNMSEGLSKAPEKLKEMFTGLGSGLKSVVSNIWGGIKNTIGGIKDKLHNWWDKSPVKKVLETGIETAKSWYNDLVKNSSNLGEMLKNTRNKIFNKVSGFFKNMTSNVTSGVKNWWNNLSWDPKSWVGLAPKTETNVAGQGTGPQTPGSQPTKDSTLQTTNNLINNDTKLTTANPLMSTSTKSAPSDKISSASSNEASPLAKLLKLGQFSQNSSSLSEIAANTNDTNNSLKVLGEAMFKLAMIFDKKLTSNGKTTIIASNNQQSQITSASEIANTNSDPIRRVRMQFA